MNLLIIFLLLPLVQGLKTLHYKGITEEDQIVKTQVYSWALDRINQKNKKLDKIYYNREFTGLGIDVFVIDTGINKNQYFNFTCHNIIEDNCDTSNFHGTFVGSLIGSYEFGVAPDVKITNLKVLNDYGIGYNSDVIKALDWIQDNKNNGIINMSLGGNFSKILNLKIKELHQKGFIVVVAGGNENKDACLFSPSSSPFAITVGATDINDKKAKFSNYGNCINIKAPGVDIIGAYKSSYIKSSGTSFSAPLVTGAVAIKLQELKSKFKLKKKKNIIFI